MTGILDRKVAIPASHFTESVKRNYSDHKMALIREFLQNAIDAGATEVRFTADDTGLTIDDNGCGMDEDVLVKALLTMSGTHKRAGAIGGFGAAKEILLFQHEKFWIHSRDNFVNGKVLDYNLQKGETRVGTCVRIWFHENYEYDRSYFETTALYYLRSCDTEAKIFWNEEQVDSIIKPGKMVKELDWAKIYLRDFKDSHVHVRINGVKMFSVYAESPYQIVVEITKPSLDILTVNRDGMTYDYQCKLQALIAEIVIEKAAFGRLYNTQTTYRGKERSYNDVEFYRRVERVLFEAKVINKGLDNIKIIREAAAAIAARKGLSMDTVSKHEANDIMVEMAQTMAETSRLGEKIIDSMVRDLSMVCDHESDFVIMVQSKHVNTIPEYLKPGTMSPRFAMYAKLWKRCIRLVLSANDIRKPYTIGWVINDEGSSHQALATHEVIKGVHTILLNPMMPWLRSSVHRETFHQMLILAVHEVTHLFCKYHDETFVDTHEQLMFKTLMSVESWWKDYLAAKEEVL